MEKKSKIALSVLGVSSLTLVTTAAVYTASRFDTFKMIKGDSITTIVTQAMLDATELSSYDLGGPNGLDSKFSISLGGQRRIDGAIIYRDCGQQFVGDFLGDRFGIHNVSINPQAYNFNILFSFEDNVQSLNVEYSVEMELDSGESSSEQFTAQLKCTQIYTDFYSFLESKSKDGKYEELHRLAENTDSSPNFTYFRLSGYHYEINNTIQPGSDLKNQRIELTYGPYNTKNLVAVQFTYYLRTSNYIKPHKWLRFKLNQLEFTHTCKQ